jgi:hypothetical protein
MRGFGWRLSAVSMMTIVALAAGGAAWASDQGVDPVMEASRTDLDAGVLRMIVFLAAVTAVALIGLGLALRSNRSNERRGNPRGVGASPWL